MSVVDLAKYQDDISGLPQPLLERHVPLIHHEYPHWTYITAVCVSPPGSTLDKYLMPTERELEIVASYHDEYIERFYGDPSYGFMRHQREKHPFDIDGGANGRFLMKVDEGSWRMRHQSWEFAEPSFGKPTKTLIELLDDDRNLTDHWARWKAARPEIFEGA